MDLIFRKITCTFSLYSFKTKETVKKTLHSFVFVLLFSLKAQAGLFYEHKYIGDSAFACFIKNNQLESFFSDKLQFVKFGNSINIPFTNPKELCHYANMFAFSDGSGNYYSYGDFCALSGDHSVDVYQLYEGLFTKGLFESECKSSKLEGLRSALKDALRKQDEAIDRGEKEASYYNIYYILLANEDQSHFQRPPESFEDMLSKIDYSLLSTTDSVLSIPCEDALDEKHLKFRKSLDKLLLKLNNSSKYAIFHLIALYYATAAANDCRVTPEYMATDFKIALMFNAFADHFLQDAFAGGHIPVQRTFRGMDNKGVHDFYCRNGLNVVNEKGDFWRTYGDNYYDDQTNHYAIEANVTSLNEIWECYETVVQHNTSYPNDATPVPLFVQILDSLKKNSKYQNSIPRILHQNFKAYAIMPIPLTKKQYEDSIKLKSGSKYGMFVDGSILLNNHQGIYGWRAAFSLLGYPGSIIGLGKLATKMDENKKIKSGKRELPLWVSFLGIDFSKIKIAGNFATIIGWKTDFSLYDRWTAGYTLGNLSYNTNYFLFEPYLGYEIKLLSCPIAPSINLMADFSHACEPIFGINLTIRIY
jgi:hypothetical protein